VTPPFFNTILAQRITWTLSVSAQTIIQSNIAGVEHRSQNRQPTIPFAQCGDVLAAAGLCGSMGPLCA